MNTQWWIFYWYVYLLSCCLKQCIAFLLIFSGLPLLWNTILQNPDIPIQHTVYCSNFPGEYIPHSCTKLFYFHFHLINILYILHILYCQSSTFYSYLCACNDCSFFFFFFLNSCFIYPTYYVYCNAHQNHQGKFLAFEIFLPIYLFRSLCYISW